MTTQPPQLVATGDLSKIVESHLEYWWWQAIAESNLKLDFEPGYLSLCDTNGENEKLFSLADAISQSLDLYGDDFKAERWARVLERLAQRIRKKAKL